MRRKCLPIGLLLLALPALSLQSPTPPAESLTDQNVDVFSELGEGAEMKMESDGENVSYVPFPEEIVALAEPDDDRSVDDWDYGPHRIPILSEFHRRRRDVRPANASSGPMTKSSPLRAFLIEDDGGLSVEEDPDESFPVSIIRPTLTTTTTTTTTTTPRMPLPNLEATQCVKICKILINRRQNTKERISCKHFLAFRDCLTRRCRPTNRGYAMVLREMQLAINEEICHIRDIEFSADRIAQCDAATLQMEKELGRKWATCNSRYTNATSVPELCRTIEYCYLKIPFRYPDECLYARRFLKYFVLAEFAEASNGLLAVKCPEIFPTADVDAYLPNQPYDPYL